MNKLLVPTIITLAIVVDIGAFFFFQKSTLPELQKVQTEPQKVQTLSPATQDKFSLWQKPSFFRGAAVHPYTPYGEEEGRIYITKQDFQDLRKKSANIVSLNYPGPFRVLPPYGIDEEALEYLDNAINWAEEVGLYAIIHFRNGPGKSEETFYGKEGREDELIWYSEEAKAKWVQMWQFVARRYKDKPHIIGYNLIVEPHPEDAVKQNPLSAQAWVELAKRITNSIREVDKDTPIIVGSTVWSNPIAFADLKPTGGKRTIYSFHMYEPYEFTHQGLEWAGKGGVSGLTYPGMIPSDVYEETRYWNKALFEEFLQPVLAFQKENNVPIFAGEFGCNRRLPSCVTYMKDLLEIFEENGFSYTYYIWNEDDDFDYQKEVSGNERVPESRYMKLFKKYWSNNQYFQPPARSSSQTPAQESQTTPLKNPTTDIEKAVTKTLKDAAAFRGLRIGGFYQAEFSNEDAYEELFKQEFNIMTIYMYYEGGVEHTSRDSYDFSLADKTVDFALKNGFEIHGHPLVWFEEMPAWVKETPVEQIETVMNEHIDTVVGRYKGRVKLWDVVNEAVDNDGSLRSDHKWFEAMGDEYIEKAFIRTHKADPKAILRYNDFAMENNKAKFNGVKNLLKNLREKGVPVHALGWQMHVTPGGGGFDPDTLSGGFDPDTLLARMNEIADLGIDNYITELDVQLPENPTPQDYEAQKQTYKTAIKVFLKARRHKTLVVWGLRDGSPHWLTKNHPLPFDERYQKKPAYFGIQEALLGK